ncbi:unnamed protein product [Closterium sp. Yama58-4]|nr:unnamed protein product [Closterium sp. Yama58-4]
MRADRAAQRERWEGLLANIPLQVFTETLRVDRNVFDYLVDAYVSRHGTGRRVVAVETVVAMTLVYLGTGATYRQLGLQFGVAPQHAQRLIRQFIVFVKEQLGPLWVKWPEADELAGMADDFRYEGGIPGVVGAVDGTFIKCRGFGRHKDDFKNRKGFYSIILQIICDSNGIIWSYLAGYPGCVNDARVFNNSTAKRRIEAGDIGDYLLVADAAYAHQNHICLPYRATPGVALPEAQDKWNTQQSRQRIIIECVNGRLKGKWRVLDERMECHTRLVPQTVGACIVLQNIELTIGSRDRLGPPNVRDRWWLDGPAARLRLTGPSVRGFNPQLRRRRWTAAIYASWLVAHPENRRTPHG